MRKAFKTLFVLAVVAAISAGYWYTLTHYETRVAELEKQTTQPPEVSREDLQRVSDQSNAAFELALLFKENMAEAMAASDTEIQETLKRIMKLEEDISWQDHRLEECEAELQGLDACEQMLSQLAEDLKSQEAMVLPEKFAEDLSPFVNIHIFTSMVMPATANHGELRIESDDGISGWVSNIGGEPIIFAAAHIPKRHLSGDIVCYFGDGRPSTAVTLFSWTSGRDCAIFKFKPGYKYEGGYLELGNSDDLKRLSPVAVMGSPDSISQNTHFMASYGYVMDPKFKSKYSGPQPCVILHWAILNSGNSGGPLLDRYGRVVGMNVMVMDGSTWVVDEEHHVKDMKFRSLVYAATPVNDIKRILPKLMKGGEVKHGWVSGLEIKLSSLIEPGDFKDLGLAQPAENVPIVTKVSQASGAYKAGIKRGDMLVSVNDVKVLDEVDFQREITNMDPGETAKIVVRREGKEVEVLAKTTTFFWSPPGPPPMTIEPSKKK